VGMLARSTLRKGGFVLGSGQGLKRDEVRLKRNLRKVGGGAAHSEAWGRGGADQSDDNRDTTEDRRGQNGIE